MRTYLNIKCRKGEAPVFESKVDGVVEKLTNVTGTFKNVTFREKKDTFNNDEPYQEMQLLLDAADGTELVICYPLKRGVTRTLLNSLISKESHGKLRLGLYSKNSFPNISATGINNSGNEDFLGRKLSWEEQQEYIVTTDLPDDKKHRDYTKLEEHLKEESLKLQPMKVEEKDDKEVIFGEEKKKDLSNDPDADLLPF